MSFEGRFAGQVVIVTGAARGIGAATARRFAAEGASVVLLDLEGDAAGATAADMTDAGLLASAAACDVADSTQVDRIVDAIAADHGRIDVLVNNAGLTRDNLVFKMSEDEWDSVIDVNLKSVFLMSRAVQRHMVPAGRGRIVNVSSTSAQGNRGQSNYSAAKAGIQGLTATLAIELGPKGINVNAVAPGFIATSMTDAMARRIGSTPEQVQAMAAKNIPLQRVGQPEDVAAVIAFLASDDASYVAGQTIHVHGGGRI